MRAAMVGGGLVGTACASPRLRVAAAAIAWGETPGWNAHFVPDR
jgi:hypothetical protein